MTADEPGRSTGRRDEDGHAVGSSEEGETEDDPATTGNPVAEAIDDAAEFAGVASGGADPERQGDKVKSWIEKRAEEVEARERTRSGRTGRR